MKKHFLWMLLSVLTVTAFGQQLKHWPVYAKKSGSDVLQDMAQSVTPPYSYGAFTYPGIPPSAKVLCSNAYYNTSGNLVFYVVQTDELVCAVQVGQDIVKEYRIYFYDNAGNLVNNCTSGGVMGRGCLPGADYVYAPYTTEINIVPVPNCGEFVFHVIAGDKLIVLDMHASTKKIIYHCAFTEAFGINPGQKEFAGEFYYSPTAVWAPDRESYFIYFIGDNVRQKPARLFKIQISLNLCAAKKCAENPIWGDVYSYKISESSISLNGHYFPFNIDADFSNSVVSELELSADGKHLLFNDRTHIYSFNFTDPGNPDLFASLDTNSYDTFAIPELSPSISYHVSGLEYSEDNNEIYYTVFDPGNLSLAASTPALRRVNISTGIHTTFANTGMFARSQLEMGLDRRVYAISENLVGYISPLHVLNTFVPVSAPDKILLNPSTNPNPGIFDLYTLPDQLDSHVFNSAYFNDPVVYEHTIKICELENPLDPAAIDCGSSAYGNDQYRTMVRWYKCPVSANPGDPSCVFLGESFEYTIPGIELQGSVPLKYVAEYTDSYGCVKREVFNIVYPPVDEEQVHEYICYGNSFPRPASCGVTTTWYAGLVTNPYTAGPGSDFYSVVANPLTASTTITALCRDASGCITKKIVYHLHVSLQAYMSQTTVQICEGEWFNPNDYKPAGWNTTEFYFPGVYNSGVLPFHRYDERGCLVETFELHLDVLPVTETETIIGIPCGTIIDLNNYNCSPAGTNNWFKYDLITGGKVPTGTHLVITQPGTYYCEGKNPCCRLTLNVMIMEQRQNASITVCEGTTVNPGEHLPPGFEPEGLLGPIVAYSSQVVTISSVNFLGCVSYFDLTINVTPVTVQHAFINVPCGTDLDLSLYNCAPGGTNTWFVETPYVSSGREPVNPLFSTVRVMSSTTFYCEGTNPCCSLVLHVSVNPAEATTVTIEACEGDLVDYAPYLAGCVHNNPSTAVIATVSQVIPLECYNEIGCLVSLTYLNLVVKPKKTDIQLVFVYCGKNYTLPAYSPLCNGEVSWFYFNQHNILTPVAGNTVIVTGPQTYYGYNQQQCCSLEYHVVMVPDVVPETYDICYIDGRGLPTNICPSGSTETWTKNDTIHPSKNFDEPNKTYRVICTDDATGCIKSDITFNVSSFGCNILFRCYEESMNIPSPCPPGFTPQWTKNGAPYPSNPDGSVTPDGKGYYEVICFDANGNPGGEQTKYFIYPCPEGGGGAFGKTGSTAVKNAEVREPQSLVVYPNPANDRFTVEFNIADATSMEITDMLGRVVYTQALTSGSRKVSVSSSDWNNGMYLVRVYTRSNTVQTTKLLKAK